MGTPWYAVSSSADQEVVAALVPQTHAGPVRTTPFDELQAGQYNAADWQSAPTAGMKKLLKLFEHELEGAQSRLPGVEGFMIIEEWQDGLKKITLRVTWNGGNDSFSQDVYVHRDSNYQD